MSRTKQVTTISFDGDATLWDFRKVMRHSLALVLSELQRRLPDHVGADLTVDTLISIREAIAVGNTGATHEAIRYRAFKRTLELVGHQDIGLAGDLYALYMKHRFDDIELYPDVRPTLNALCEDFSVGLISNGNSYPHRCQLPDRFRFAVFSQDVGVKKPNPGIFFVACQQAECKPTELMHVGDSLESDVAGANCAGAVSVWLNRESRQNETAIVPDYEIHSLRELLGTP